MSVFLTYYCISYFNFSGVYRRRLIQKGVPKSQWQAKMNIATKIWTDISSDARREEIDRYYRELYAGNDNNNNTTN